MSNQIRTINLFTLKTQPYRRKLETSINIKSLKIKALINLEANIFLKSDLNTTYSKESQNTKN